METDFEVLKINEEKVRHEAELWADDAWRERNMRDNYE